MKLHEMTIKTKIFANEKIYSYNAFNFNYVHINTQLTRACTVITTSLLCGSSRYLHNILGNIWQPQQQHCLGGGGVGEGVSGWDFPSCLRQNSKSHKAYVSHAHGFLCSRLIVSHFTLKSKESLLVDSFFIFWLLLFCALGGSGCYI